MTKAKYLNHIRALYRAALTSDSDRPAGDWMHAEMAGIAGCAILDKMLHEMVRCGVLTGDEHQEFYDTL